MTTIITVLESYEMKMAILAICGVWGTCDIASKIVSRIKRYNLYKKTSHSLSMNGYWMQGIYCSTIEEFYSTVNKILDNLFTDSDYKNFLCLSIKQQDNIIKAIYDYIRYTAIDEYSLPFNYKNCMRSWVFNSPSPKTDKETYLRDCFYRLILSE